ncbi:hypothetical protein C7B62_16540 [Pleurocapsa sp. CCALA 161]|uniref:GNAT family N-acetyltransferase n=1 Tax=Pleurocapsa sp. CCALA 161 TaxID=2107688 RepID=UPI000D062978|nr:GNAT family N-acetyltransferase [Pleurocapsa sp. CCALA 161]PSB08510.1 hypothetical protein C7B62_16540 [Pleurocapsa sp. CCALA 161]
MEKAGDRSPYDCWKIMIRHGKIEDLEQIEIFDEFGGNRESEILRKSLRVYIVNNKVSGYISIIEKSCLCNHTLISYLCVHSEYRYRGIASLLLSKVEQIYTNQKVFVSTESNNLAMLSLIKKRKYTPSGSLSGLNSDGSDELYFYKN